MNLGRSNGHGLGSILSALVLAGTLALFGLGQVEAQASKRCDLVVKSTPGVGAEPACLDLVSLTNGGPAFQTASNTTRISQDGFKFCPNAFQVSSTSDADVVFIYDNSTSMRAAFAYINPVLNDTVYYFDDSLCTSKATLGTFAIDFGNGVRTIKKLTNNSGCTSYSGDPYEVRAKVIKSAIDSMALNSPTSTAGVTGFALKNMHPLAPLQLNTTVNVNRVKDSAMIDSSAWTLYAVPLQQAYSWLKNPALIKTKKQVIIFISDGAPVDSVGNKETNPTRAPYLPLVDVNIPIYSIYLGQVATKDTAKLKELSDLTHGNFTRVQPNNIAGIGAVMQSIIKSILVSTLPRSIQVTNTTFTPPQISQSLTLTKNTDNSVNVALDSILGLKLGVNNFTVKVTMNDTLIRNYSFNIKADGPLAATSTTELTCYDPPTLALLNKNGVQDTAYPAGSTAYQVKLTRASNDLASVTILATAKDSTAKPVLSDAETLVLNVGSGAAPTYLGPATVNGSSMAPVSGNAVLESDANGKLTLNWVHPRDAREFASYTLPGTIIPPPKVDTVKGFVDFERVNSVSKGVILSGTITNPVVIFGGAKLLRANRDSATVTHGDCLSNCVGNAVALADPNKTPSFIFKTASPFSYDLMIYDHFGNFVNKSKGSVSAAQWQMLPKRGDSVAVVMSILPVASNGALIATGVYVLKATIKTQATSTKDSSGVERRTPAGNRMLINRFGYSRP